MSSSQARRWRKRICSRKFSSPIAERSQCACCAHATRWELPQWSSTPTSIALRCTCAKPMKPIPSVRQRRAESYLNIAKILDVARALRRRRDSSWIRISFRECEVRPGLRRCGSEIHRPHSRRHGGDGIEDTRAPSHGASRRSFRARHFARSGVVRAGRRGGRENRLSRDAESGRRRRRQRHAPGARAGKSEVCSRGGAQRGGAVFRRQRSLHREGDRQSSPHRDAGARRRAWQHRLSWRARMLAAAPPSEGDRRSAFAHRGCRHAAPHGRSGGPRGAGRGLHQRRHGRVSGRSAKRISISSR